MPDITSAALAGSGTAVFPTPGLTTTLYKPALGKLGSMKRNGSADALADCALVLSPVDACTCNDRVLTSPDLDRVLSVPENEVAVVPHVPSLHTATNESPAAVVWTDRMACPIPCVGSEPAEVKLVAIRIGTMSPELPPVTSNEYVITAVAADP